MADISNQLLQQVFHLVLPLLDFQRKVTGTLLTNPTLHRKFSHTHIRPKVETPVYRFSGLPMLHCRPSQPGGQCT